MAGPATFHPLWRAMATLTWREAIGMSALGVLLAIVPFFFIAGLIAQFQAPERALVEGARTYCEGDAAARAAIDRRVFYRLEEKITVEIRCAR